MIRLLFVCLGNICRSPIAEGICRARVKGDPFWSRDGREIAWDSAGTGGWHEGAAPDPRAISVAAKYDAPIHDLKARKVLDDDFERFDLILAMDRDNLEALRKRCPEGFEDRIHLLMDFVADSRIREVPDPYFFRDASGFERIYATIDEGVAALLDHLKNQA